MARTKRIPRVPACPLLALLMLLAVWLFAGCSGASAPAASPAARPATGTAAAKLPPIRHVWVIMLENESGSTSFGPNAPSPYLAKTLPSLGVYVPHYYGIGHASLDNYIAMVSGQPPNPLTQSDCQQYVNFTGTVQDGVAEGVGCVYPTSVPSIASQLTMAGMTWKEYAESMPGPCSHAPLGQSDPQQGETPGDPYAPRHNPFVYFHAIIDSASYCDSHVANLNALPSDIASPGTTPNYSFITPDVCGDGHDATCTAEPPRPGGFAGINNFLETWVPKITGSQAYQQGGLLIVTFDEADTSDATSCCGEKPGVTSPEPGLEGPGGGDVGAVLLSPYIKAGSVSTQAYNHYSQLASIEDLFGLPHIGMAAAAGLPTFGTDIFNLTKPGATCSASRRLVLKLPAGVNAIHVHVQGATGAAGTKIARGHQPRVTITVQGNSAESVNVTVTARRHNGKHYRVVRRFSLCALTHVT